MPKAGPNSGHLGFFRSAPRPGGDLDEAGFSIWSPDRGYHPIIIDSLASTDAPGVWSNTGAFCSVYRGDLGQVFECLGLAFSRAYLEELRLCLEARVSHGHPLDYDCRWRLGGKGAQADAPLHAVPCFEVKARLALYTLGCPNYHQIIAQAVQLAEEARRKAPPGRLPPRACGQDFLVRGRLSLCPMLSQDRHQVATRALHLAEETGLNPRQDSDATMLDGQVFEVLDYLRAVCEMSVPEGVHDDVLHFAISAGGPGEE
ncbi:MAG: Ykof family thiamine-binding protein [Deltaproteobacteria bacterium]|jgi:hypothetical protein|nr:Ykof family thiamine-binding protein [Deltaproteobacteria bacterium]